MWEDILEDFVNSANLLNSANLVDVYREKNPLGKQYTWHQAGGLAASKIDRVYVSNEFLRDCGQISTHSNEYSDHGMVVMDFTIRNSIRGKSYWKANISVFEDKDFIADFVSLWERRVGNRQSSFDLNRWLNMKIEIANLIQIQSVRCRQMAVWLVVVVNHCFTSLFGSKGLLSGIVIP